MTKIQLTKTTNQASTSVLAIATAAMKIPGTPESASGVLPATAYRPRQTLLRLSRALTPGFVEPCLTALKVQHGMV